MARFTIYSPAGVALYEGTPTFTGQYMKPGLLEFREVAMPSLVDLVPGCYVDYTRTGNRYRIYTVPQLKKQARSLSYGGAYVYQSVQLYDASKMLEYCPFRDLVLGDNRIHFSTQPSISTFEGCDGLARRFEACLQDQYGENSWSVRIATENENPALYDLMIEPREFTVSGVNILECLDKIYEIWPEVGWIYKVENGIDTIVIGGSGINPNEGTYAYGKGNGLTSLTRVAANAEEIANRIFAYGSSRNMLPRWYNNQNIKDAESVDIQNLMLPVDAIPSMDWNGWGLTDGERDAAKAFVEDTSSIAKNGLRPATVYFDGSGEYPEIYPSVRETTIGMVRTAIGDSTAKYYPSTAIYTDADARIDKLLSAQATFDSGLAGDVGKSAAESESEVLGNLSGSGSVAGGSNTSIILATRTYTMSKTNPTDLYVSITGDGTITPSGGNCAVYLAISIQKGDGTDFSEVKRQLFELEKDENDVFHSRTVSTKASGVSIVAGDVIRVYLSVFIMNTGSTTLSYSYSLAPGFNFSAEFSRKKTFNISVRQLGFDIEAQANLGNGKTIAMRTGMCAGRSFAIKSVQYNSVNDCWDLECWRTDDESLSQWFPNTDYPVRGQETDYDGDEFVLLDIAMPDIYVSMAEQKLLMAANELLADTAVERWQYSPEIDAKYMVENNRTIRAGEYMSILDITSSDIGPGTLSYFRTSGGGYLLTSNGERIVVSSESGAVVTVFVDVVVINEGEALIPTYKVTLRDRKKKTWTESQSVELSSSKSVSNITDTTQSAVGGDSFFQLDENGNVTLKPQYQNLWVPGWLAAGGIGDEGGGGGVSYLRELSDVYHNDSGILRSDGTAAQTGDALVYNPSLGWVASPVSGGGGGGGADLDDVWASLTNSVTDAYANTKINISHIPLSDLDTWVAAKGYALSSSVPTESTVSGWGFTKNTGTVTSVTLTSGTGISVSNSGTAITTLGSRTISINSTYQTYINHGEAAYNSLSNYATVASLTTLSNRVSTLEGESFFMLDSSGNVTLKANYSNLWVPGWLAAGGVGSGSGGGGTDLNRVWDSLTNNTDKPDVKINVAHIPDLSGIYLTNHQNIYALTLSAGSFTAGSYTPNSSAKSFNIPTTLDHLADGATRKLSNYVTIAGGQTITGAKTFSAWLTASSGIVTGGDIYPSTDLGGSLGYSTRRFSNLNVQDISTRNINFKSSDNSATTGHLSFQAGYMILRSGSNIGSSYKQLTFHESYGFYPDGTGVNLGYSGVNNRWATIYGVNGNLTGDLSMESASHIDIGPLRIEYDATNKALHITKVSSSDTNNYGLYSDGFIAAGGIQQS